MSEDIEWIVFVQIFPNLDLPGQINLPNGCVLARPPLGVDLLYGPRNLEVKADYPTVQAVSQSASINSDTYYFCKISDSDENRAIARVMKAYDPQVRLALYMTIGLEVSTTPIQIMNMSSHVRFSADQTVASFRAAPTQRGVDYTRVKNIVRDLNIDVLGPAIDHLRRGDSLSDLKTSAGTLAEDAALLEYAKVIEYITKSEASQRDADYEQKREKILKRLQKDLSGSKSAHNLASRVSGAASELFSLERRSVLLRVASFAQRVSMSKAWRESATELINARNKSLAHPGEGLPQAVRDRLANARKVAIEALFASLPEGNQSRGLEIPNWVGDGPLAPGPKFNWSEHRRKTYRLDGSVEWITHQESDGDEIETQIATSNSFEEFKKWS